MSDPTRGKPIYSQPRLGGTLFSFNITLTAEERDLITDIGHANCIGIGRYMSVQNRIECYIPSPQNDVHARYL